MSIPKYHEFTLPILNLLNDNPTGLSTAEIYANMADWAKLTDDERMERLSSGSLTYKDRISWAVSYLKKAGFTQSLKRGHYEITDAGKERVKNTAPLTPKELKSLFITTDSTAITNEDTTTNDDITPQDQIEQAIKVIRHGIVDELVTKLKSQSPEFFEKAILQVLKAMGYVGEYGSIKHSGKSGDGGIDGVLHLDRLGLERVHVQAKRWEGNVSEPTIRDFAGALDIVGATKGVIITTSDFSAPAKTYAERSPKMIRLVNGTELAELMIDFGVGVSRQRTIVIPKVDLDFFED